MAASNCLNKKPPRRQGRKAKIILVFLVPWWFIMKTLQGKCIVVTRAEEQSGALVERLEALGATVHVCPMIAIVPPEDSAPLDSAIKRLAEYNWLMLTSANAVRALFEHTNDVLPEHVRVGAVGPATAKALMAYGVVPRFMPSTHTAEAMVAEIGDMAGQRVLIPVADIARETLAAGLRGRGAQVDVVTAYRTVRGKGVQQLVSLLRDKQVDAITFTSPSTVRSMLQGFAEQGVADVAALLHGVALVCIGPTTASALRKAGLPAVVAREQTAEGLVAAVVEVCGVTR